MDPTLEKWIPLLQIVTNAALTTVAICIAVASLIVAYRNNFGWEPFVMIKRSYVRKASIIDAYVAVIELEIWNRRKYPVAIREIAIKFGTLAVRKPTGSDDTWDFEGALIYNRNDYTIPGSTNETIKFEFSPDEHVPSRELIQCGVHVTCFDPRTKKTRSLYTPARLYAGKYGKGPWA